MKKLLLGLMLVTGVSYADDSVYKPVCEERKCNQVYNIGFVSTGYGTQGTPQDTYGFGYLHLFRTRGNEILALGVMVNGNEKNGINGGQVMVGMGF